VNIVAAAGMATSEGSKSRFFHMWDWSYNWADVARTCRWGETAAYGRL